MTFTATRRTLLGGAATAGLVGAVAAPAPARRPVTGPLPTLGLITPSVPGRPAVSRRGDRLAAGLGVALPGVRLHRAEVPFGLHGVEDSASDLLRRGADVLVVALADAVGSRVLELAGDAGAGVVLAGVGAHVPDHVGGAVRTSLQHWQSALTLGQYAARRLGPSLHQLVLAPDAGYDSVFAVRRGFTGAGGRDSGTTVVDTHEPGDLARAARQVRAAGAAVVHVAATGDRAARAVAALRAAGVTADLLLDPTLTEREFRRGLGAGARGAHTVTAAVDRARLGELRRAMSAGGRGRPDAFAVLGHDTGLLLGLAVGRRGRARWSTLPDLLAGARVRGVRGVQRVHASGLVSTPLVVRRFVAAGSGVKVRDVAARPRVGGRSPALAVVTGRHASGYLNEYLTT